MCISSVGTYLLLYDNVTVLELVSVDYCVCTALYAYNLQYSEYMHVCVCVCTYPRF